MNEARLTILITLLLLLPLIKPGAIPKIEDATIKVCTFSSVSAKKPPKTIIAAIDERSIEKLGEPPWPRAEMARVIEQLKILNAKAIVIDSFLVRSSSSNEAHTQIIRNYGNSVVAGFEFYPSLADLPPGYEYILSDDKKISKFEEMALPQAPADDSQLSAMAGIDFDSLMPSGMHISRNGFSNIFSDDDNVVRRHMLAVRLKHRVYPSLAVAAAAAFKNFTPLITADSADRPSSLVLGDLKVGIKRDAGISINFRGKYGSFPIASIGDIIDGKLPPETIYDKIVLIGVTNPSMASVYATPLGRMPAIEIAANSLETILNNEPLFMLTNQRWLAIFVAAAGLIFALAAVRLSPAKRVIWTIGSIAAVWIAAIAIFSLSAIVIPAAHISLAFTVLCIATCAWQIIAIEMPMRRQLKTFKMRMSEDLLKHVLNNPLSFDSRGRQHTLTALALDIRGFGAMARPISPDKLCSFMRIFRTLIAQVLLKYGAFIESWAGDECRTIFGAPIPLKKNKLEACRAAFAAVHVLSSANAEFEHEFGLKNIRLDIGIASGNAAAGDLGPHETSNFGVIGGAVDSSAALRALNRIYRTSILVDDETRAAVEGSFSLRPLDPVILPGEEKPVIIHELFGEAGIILPQMDGYLAGRDAYLRGDFEKAIHLLSKVLMDQPHDGPSQLFMSRSRRLMNFPSKGDWKGIWSQL